MKHIKLFESFTDEPIYDYDEYELEQLKKEGCGYAIFYPRRPGGTAFTLATSYEVNLMREMLEKKGARGCRVGFGPYFHRTGVDAKSMVVIMFDPEKDKEIVYDIIERYFSLNYPIHQLD